MCSTAINGSKQICGTSNLACKQQRDRNGNENIVGILFKIDDTYFSISTILALVERLDGKN